MSDDVKNTEIDESVEAETTPVDPIEEKPKSSRRKKSPKPKTYQAIRTGRPVGDRYEAFIVDESREGGGFRALVNVPENGSPSYIRNITASDIIEEL